MNSRPLASTGEDAVEHVTMACGRVMVRSCSLRRSAWTTMATLLERQKPALVTREVEATAFAGDGVWSLRRRARPICHGDGGWRTTVTAPGGK